MENLFTIIDIGSNTVKCSIISFAGDNSFEVIGKKTTKLGLGSRRNGNSLTYDALADLISTINEYCKYATDNGCKKSNVYACATASLRGIDNFEEVNNSVYSHCKITIHLLSGIQESKMSFAGFLAHNKECLTGAMVDMGGASTEILTFDKTGIINSHSFNFGCLFLYKKFVCDVYPTNEEIDSIYNFVLNEIKDYPYMKSFDYVYLVGGTAKATMQLLNEFYCVGNDSFDKTTFEKLYARLTHIDNCEKEIIEKLIPDRKELIIPGLVAFSAISNTIGNSTFKIADGGLREGVAITLRNGGSIGE